MASTPTDRLRDGRDIAAVLRGRRARAGRLAVMHARARDDEHPARLAVVASKRVGDAVTRNRAKRLLREAAARVDWRPGTDVVLVARSSCGASTMWPVHEELTVLAGDLEVGVVPTTGAAP